MGVMSSAEIIFARIKYSNCIMNDKKATESREIEHLEVADRERKSP